MGLGTSLARAPSSLMWSLGNDGEPGGLGSDDLLLRVLFVKPDKVGARRAGVPLRPRRLFHECLLQFPGSGSGSLLGVSC